MPNTQEVLNDHQTVGWMDGWRMEGRKEGGKDNGWIEGRMDGWFSLWAGESCKFWKEAGDKSILLSGFPDRSGGFLPSSPPGFSTEMGTGGRSQCSALI